MTEIERDAVERLFRTAENMLKWTTQTDAIPVGAEWNLRGAVRKVKFHLRAHKSPGFGGSETRGVDRERSDQMIILRDLVGWADYMGGWEAPVWRRARRAIRHVDEAADGPSKMEEQPG